MKRAVLTWMLALTATAASLRADGVIHVDANAPAGGDGASWATAINDLQDALALVDGGPPKQIWIASSVYRPDGGSGDRHATFFVPDGTALYGGFAGDEQSLEERDPVANPVTLSGDLASDDAEGATDDNSIHVVTVIDATVTLSGLTVSGGHADGAASFSRGSGVFAILATLVLEQCRFEGNHAHRGAGLYAAQSALTIDECVFDTNTSGGGGAGIDILGGVVVVSGSQFTDNATGFNGGGAIRIDGVEAMIAACTFTGNTSTRHGGAVLAEDSNVEVVGSVFFSNAAGDDCCDRGGGVASDETTVLTVTLCEFEGNEGYEGGGLSGHGPTTVSTSLFVANDAIRGAGLHVSAGASLEAVACTFDANDAYESGGGASLDGPVTMTDCAFVDNIADDDAGMRVLGDGPVEIESCSFSGNDGGGLRVALTEPTSVGPASIVDCDFVANVGYGLSISLETDGVVHDCRLLQNEGWGLACEVDPDDSLSVSQCEVTGNFQGVLASNGFSPGRGATLIEGCLISDNTVGPGRGVRLNRFRGVLRNCTIVSNTRGIEIVDAWDARVAGCSILGHLDAVPGAGISVESGPAVIESSLIAGNTSTAYAGGIALVDADVAVRGCTIHSNGGSAIVGGIHVDSDSTLELTSSILWNNTGPGDATGAIETSQIVTEPGGEATVNACCIQGLTGRLGGAGNIGADPLFVDPFGPDGVAGTTDDDLHLAEGSPCINAADPSAFSDPRAADIDGEPRIRECVPDMGADETPYFPDCNDNGLSDGCDIAEGASIDIDDNGVPDECQDCNGNGLFDPQEIADGLAEDCDGDDVPDECGPDCNGNGVMDVCEILDAAAEDCDGNLVPDECDPDCNANGLVDGCEVITVIAIDSGPLQPVQGGVELIWVVEDPVMTFGPVTLQFEALSDLGSSNEFISVSINGKPLGDLFVDGDNCAPVQEWLPVSPSTWNEAVASGALSFEFLPSDAVSGTSCGAAAYVAVLANYVGPSEADADADGVPDDCPDATPDLDGDGDVDGADLGILLGAWGDCPGCPADLDGDGDVDGADLGVLLGSWT